MSFLPRVVEDAPGGAVVVFETSNMDGDLDEAVLLGRAAPYGRVLWPSAPCVARVLATLPLANKLVLEVGCGTALCAVVAARLGARVLATDVDAFALEAARQAAARNAVAIDCAHFDITSGTPLPPADVVVAADLLYEPELAAALARRIREAVGRGSTFVVGDPGRAGRVQLVKLLAEWHIAATFLPVDGRVDVAVIANSPSSF